jgi:hypothetical protein
MEFYSMAPDRKIHLCQRPEQARAKFCLQCRFHSIHKTRIKSELDRITAKDWSDSIGDATGKFSVVSCHRDTQKFSGWPTFSKGYEL